MHHASPSIGALAAALAKAQAELVNPEKSQVAVVTPSGSSGPERSFRYAPLASGLDIIRKTLGRHEIATVQTTRIDDGAGLVRLTTTLAHASGEWILSEWPVCPISETAVPHRLGAALTYARRYALFTLVGIAGEDDAEARDLPTPEARDGAAQPMSAETSRAATEPLLTRRLPRRATTVPFTTTDSAVLREQLEAELSHSCSVEELTAWATRSLDRKNALRQEDATAIERAFEARLLALAPPEAPSPSLLPEPQATALSPPATTEGPGAAAFLIPKTIRRRDKRHLKFIVAQPCLVCGRCPSDAHHLRFSEPRALGRKVSDEFTVPLCRVHHRAVHARGDEKAWWTELQIDPLPIAQELWSVTR